MTEPRDTVMVEIGGAIELARSASAEAARERFAEIWDRLGPDGDPFHRCALAHYAADVQTDPREELRWDLRALEAAGELSDERAQEYHRSLKVAGFYPSLHLNLADVYRRLDDRDKAKEHLERAQDAVGTLGDDAYGRMIRNGIARCAAQLGAG